MSNRQTLKRTLNMLSAIAALAFALTACSSKTVDRASCEQADWYEIGRRDGSQGFPSERLSQHQRECAKQAVGEWEAMYSNGRNAGLVEFCDVKNGYELGRSGVPYYYVCPSTVEPQFLSAYRRGQSARTIEIENQKLDQQIIDLVQRLTHSGDRYEQREITSQLSKLRSLRAKNERALGKITVK